RGPRQGRSRQAPRPRAFRPERDHHVGRHPGLPAPQGDRRPRSPDRHGVGEQARGQGLGALAAPAAAGVRAVRRSDRARALLSSPPPASYPEAARLPARPLMLRAIPLLLLPTVALAVPVVPRDLSPAAEQKRLQGDWLAASLEHGEEKATGAVLAKINLA